jgi:phage baseplate assembly protein gpV
VPGTTAATSVSGTLMLQPDGAPISYDWTSHADKTNGAHVVFSNGTAKITLQMQGARPFEQDLSFNAPVIAVLDNNLYDQYALLAKLYDWSKRGTQTFPVLIPQDLTPGTISVKASGSTTLDGKSYEGLRVTTADLEVLLLLDSNHRLMRLEVPSAKVSVVRQ